MRKYIFLVAGLAVLCVWACSKNSGREVVVYTSVDEIFARPVAKKFERDRGIRVLLVTDTEETKSTGLLNRLIAEKERHVADVFWSGDPVRAAILKRHGVAAPYKSTASSGLPEEMSDPDGYWTAFSTRARVLVYNADIFKHRELPSSIFDLVSPEFKSRACIANPLFGTTSMHVAALFQVMGKDKAEQFLDRFAENGGQVLASNGDVKAKVASGKCALGLTDTDDVNVAIQEGLNIGFVLPDQNGMGTLLVPNCAVLIKDAPHQTEGMAFIDFLLEAETERMLAVSDAAQIPLRKGVKGPSLFPPLVRIKAMNVDYSELGETLEVLMKDFLKKWVDRVS
jgi:iron(III) transport system substrate-binding protein